LGDGVDGGVVSGELDQQRKVPASVSLSRCHCHQHRCRQSNPEPPTTPPPSPQTPASPQPARTCTPSCSAVLVIVLANSSSPTQPMYALAPSTCSIHWATRREFWVAPPAMKSTLPFETSSCGASVSCGWSGWLIGLVGLIGRLIDCGRRLLGAPPSDPVGVFQSKPSSKQRAARIGEAGRRRRRAPCTWGCASPQPGSGWRAGAVGWRVGLGLGLGLRMEGMRVR